MAFRARVRAFRITAIRVAAGIVAAITSGALAAGVVGTLTPLVALAVAVVPVAALVTALLVHLALAIHATQHSFGPCRGAGFLGMGVLATGLTVGALAATGGAAAVATATTGLCVAVAMFLLGLMLLPGAATTVSARLRRGLDGLSIGVTLCFTAWVALSPGRVPSAALTTGVVAALAVAVTTVVALRAIHYRRAAVLCGAGAVAAVAGLAGLAAPLAYGVHGRALLVAAAGLLAGPALAWAGARRAGTGPVAPQPGEATLAGYPLLTVPVGAALVAAVYHLITVGSFDRTSMSLGIGAAGLLAVRETLAVADVRRYARELARKEAHFRSLVAGSNDLILVLDEHFTVRWQSPAAARLFALSDQDVLGQPILNLLHPEDVEAARHALTSVLAGRLPVADHPALLTARLRDGHGRWRDTESTISDQRGVPHVDALVLHLRDVSERRELEQELQRMSCTDQLTALPNRRELMRALADRRSVPGHAGSLLVIDLHGLERVNDERGREIGDAVLVEAARRLRTSLEPDDVPARLAGDELGVVSAAGPVLAYALGTRLLAELTRPYELPGAVIILDASVGLAEIAEGSDVEDVLHRADLARRRARQLGGNRLEWYDVCLEEQLVRRMDIERELAGAIARNELDLVFQPVVHLLDRRPAGIEALLRWRHPVLGTVLPAELVPVAEELGIAGDIANWVLQRACRHLASWVDGGNDVWVAVNMSPRQLAAPDLAARVEAALAAHRLPPERLVIEVPEGRLGHQLPAVVNQLAGLRAMGVRTALDDFGAGHASLAQLRRLPIDILKIDGALVSQPADRAGPTRPLIDVVVSLGRRLGMDMVVEGLESRTRLDEALTAGCRLGQGFLLGRPVPAEHLEAYLEDYRTPSL